MLQLACLTISIFCGVVRDTHFSAFISLCTVTVLIMENDILIEDNTALLSDLFADTSNYTCFDYNKCAFRFSPCTDDDLHPGYRYNDPSAAWVLICAIIVFFMKAGFLLIELAFAQNVREKRHIVVVKHLDSFASAFGFFLLGFDYVSQYTSPQDIALEPFQISDPVLWFFKFTFASNAATILGGCLVTSKYKLRLPAAFLSAFVISGIIHPAIARLIWTDKASLSVYRFCGKDEKFGCHDQLPFSERFYVLDFGGGGAVHLLGGVAGLVLCLFAKLHNFLENRKQNPNRNHFNDEVEPLVLREQPDTVLKRDFWEWMYPVDGGGETTSEAALGVLILWFCWFAFNCGSTESVQSSPLRAANFPYHALPSIIAVNMILAAASGGVLAVLIASWAQIRSQSDSVNANEIANGILSALVAISAGCPFVEYWAACVIGAIAVIVYHFGCWLEYKFGIDDTARVVPVHGLCGLWSMIAVSIFLFGQKSECTLHATFEGICFCRLKLPMMNYGERVASQIIAALVMIGITSIGSIIMYGILYLLPMRTHLSSASTFAKYYNRIMSRVFMVLFNRDSVNFEGNLLFTGPGEIPHPDSRILRNIIQQQDTDSELGNGGRGSVRNYGADKETLGTRGDNHTSLSHINTTTSNYTAESSYSPQCGTISEEQDDDDV